MRRGSQRGRSRARNAWMASAPVTSGASAQSTSATRVSPTATRRPRRREKISSVSVPMSSGLLCCGVGPGGDELVELGVRNRGGVAATLDLRGEFAKLRVVEHDAERGGAGAHRVASREAVTCEYLPLQA